MAFSYQVAARVSVDEKVVRRIANHTGEAAAEVLARLRIAGEKAISATIENDLERIDAEDT